MEEANKKEKKTHAAHKIEITRDPGEYDGSITKYQEWWTNMRVWLRLNGHLLVNDEERAIALWSRLRGDRAGKFAEARLAECLENGQWPVRYELKAEFEKMFKPVADKEWAMKKLETFAQGAMKIDDFAVKWLTLAK